jgi:hypothetical protein
MFIILYFGHGFYFELLINSLSLLVFLGFVCGFYYLSSFDLIVKRSSLF